MKVRIIKAVIFSLALNGSLCGCGKQSDGLVLVGESAAEMSGNSGEKASGESGLPSAAGEFVPSDAAPEDISLIYVYVCGAVNSPGVVVLQEGSRVEAALEAAGGFRQDAGKDHVNLAAKVSDGERLYFPTEEETAGLSAELPEGGGDGLININMADEAALCTLSGIGESRARDIVRYREENGPFESCEDIMNVPGIKSGVYGKIKDRIKAE